MRSTTLKVLGGVVLVTAVVWVLVLGWWQANDFQPGKLDLLLYLFFPPFAFVGGFLLLRAFIEHLKAPPRKEAPATEIKDDDPLASTSAKTSAAERMFSISLIGTWLNCSTGKTAGEVLEAVEAGVRPEPSNRQHDDDGFPVFLAEVKDLAVDQFSETLEVKNNLRTLLESPQVTRHLALIDSVLPEAVIYMRSLLDQAPTNARLRIEWLLPDYIETAHFPAMRIWLNNSHLSEIEQSRIEIKMTTIASEGEALKQIDDLVLLINREKLDNDLVLVIAATSTVEESSIQSLSIRKSLFSANNQNAQIPGESAVALLFTSHKAAIDIGVDDAVAISRASHAIRDKSVDGPGRISGTLIEHLAEQLLSAHALEATGIQALLLDSDHRASRIGEVLIGLGAKFEHLDPIKDCLGIGIATGANPTTGSLLALACSREKVLMTVGPVLCISNQHDTERAAILAMPFVAQPGTKTTST
jgi:hypothetical protein